MLKFKNIRDIFKAKGSVIVWILVYIYILKDFDKLHRLGKLCVCIGFISYLVLLYLNIKEIQNES